MCFLRKTDNGLNLRLNPTHSCLSGVAAFISVIFLSSSLVRQSGFSTKTCFPAERDLITYSACESCRVAMKTVFTESDLIMSSH